MLSVACLSQKGGVGKSTLTRLIARTYAKGGWHVKIADFNLKQKTSVDWAALRMSRGIDPEVNAEPFADVPKALKADVDLVVFDGRPDADAITLDIAKAATLIIIPCGVSLDDLQPQVRFANELRARGIKLPSILFVINQSIDSEVALLDARNFIISAGYQIADVDLPRRTGYQMAQNTGLAISETPYPSLNERADKLAQEIVDRVQNLISG